MGSDGDIQFPPGQRREKPKFEVPPWEQDKFEEMARRKQEAEAEAAKIAAAQHAAVAAEAPAPAASVPSEQEVPAPAVVQAAQAEQPMAGAEGPQLDERQVELLMMGLRAEEPRPEKTYWKIVAGSGIVSILVGIVVTTWAVVVIAAPKRQIGSGEILVEAMLLLFGLGFVGAGGWVVFKSLRQQGVL